MKVPPPG